MDEKVYKITLADGTVIENLTLNGNNFVSTETITAATFESNCSPVIINDGTIDDTHENMELVQVTNDADGNYLFVLRDLSETEIAQAKIKSDIEYIAMMCDVEL